MTRSYKIRERREVDAFASAAQRAFYFRGSKASCKQGHREVLENGDLVEVVALEDFLGRVNKRTL